MPMWQCLLYIILGLAAIIIGGQLVVIHAKNIALAWGMSETLVGLTIVAIGTKPAGTCDINCCGIQR